MSFAFICLSIARVVAAHCRRSFEVPDHFSLKDACESVDMMIATLPESTFLRRGSLSSTRSTSDESSAGSEMLGSDAPPTEPDFAGCDAPPTEPDFVTDMLLPATEFSLDMN